MSINIPQTAAYGSGILYPPNLTPALSTTVKNSGIETLILWAFHIETNGNIVFNNTPIITYDRSKGKSQYLGNANWPTQLQALMGTGSKITQMEASIGGYDTNDFLNIKTIYTNHGQSFDNTALQSNFRLFKQTFPTIALIDMDVEGPNPENYDQQSFVAFCQMLIEIGFDITFCPYTLPTYWTGSLKALNTSNPGAVKWWNLQCYAGGTGNNADTWAGYITSTIPGFNTDGFILVSGSSRYYNTINQQWQGDCVPAFKTLMSTFKGEKSVGGGFLWNIDQVEGYAEEIKTHPDPEECSSSNRSLADYISAIVAGLGL